MKETVERESSLRKNGTEFVEEREEGPSSLEYREAVNALSEEITMKPQSQDLENQPSAPSRPDSQPHFTLRPPVDVFESTDGITLWADMPGVSRERLNLRVFDGHAERHPLGARHEQCVEMTHAVENLQRALQLLGLHDREKPSSSSDEVWIQSARANILDACARLEQDADRPETRTSVIELILLLEARTRIEALDVG